MDQIRDPKFLARNGHLTVEQWLKNHCEKKVIFVVRNQRTRVDDSTFVFMTIHNSKYVYVDKFLQS
eukprot:jgi/Bigna1/61405/fgenesh1_kg.21_\